MMFSNACIEPANSVPMHANVDDSDTKRSVTSLCSVGAAAYEMPVPMATRDVARMKTAKKIANI